MSDLVKELNAENFEAMITEGLTLVDFWAPWCGPCRVQVPILKELAGKIKGKVKIAKLNVDEAADVAGQFGVQAIPTLILFKDGKEIRRFVGVQAKETLVSAISANM
jgi:thioredoxin 1